MTARDERLPEDDRTLAELVRRLVEAFQPERIYLFGSRARSEENLDSDYDLLMVVSASALPRYKREQAAFRVLCGVGASKDVLVFTRNEFECKLSVAASLPATVEREGKLIYAA